MSQLLQELKEEGFNEDSIRALYLVPVLDVAWADGKIQTAERKEILDLMEKRGIQSDSEAYRLLDTWLHSKPKDEMWTKGHLAIEPLFAELKSRPQGQTHWIFEAAERVAKATGTKSHPISAEEKAVLSRISKRLD